MFSLGQLDKTLDPLNLLDKKSAAVSRDIIYRLLQTCIKQKDFTAGRWVHPLMVGSGLDSVAVLGDHLIRFFALCGRLEEANLVFCKVAKPTVYTWHAIISAHVTHGEDDRALTLYNAMEEDGTKADRVIISSILKACGRTGAIVQGKLIHDQVIRGGLEADMVVGTTLVDMYVKCGILEEARKVFDGLSKKDAVLWGTMIAGYAQHGYGLAALELFEIMQQEGIIPDIFLLSYILRAFGNVEAIEQGKLIHHQIDSKGFVSDVDIGNALIHMYVKCGNLETASKVFNEMLIRDVVSWNTMIMGYAEHGHALAALQFFEQQQQEGIKSDKVTFLCILKACRGIDFLGPGRFIHDHVIRRGLGSDVVVGSSLIDMYAKCGSIKEAHKVFIRLPNQDRVSWNSMIAGCAHQGHGLIALQHFLEMQMEGIKPDKVTFLCTLQACGSIGATGEGKLLHKQIQISGLESDVAMKNAIIDMYAKCGSLEEAYKVFSTWPQRNQASWGAMISGYVQHGFPLRALELFEKMQEDGIKPDEVTFSCVLKACGSIGAIGQGQLIHGQIIRSGIEVDMIVGTSLVDMYATSGSLEDARKVFDEFQHRNAVLWHVMISRYAQHGHYLLAIGLFERMQQEGIKPDAVVFSCILKACGSQGALEQGKLIHEQVMRSGLQSDMVIGNTLIDMYVKCGSLEEACTVFDGLLNRNRRSWGALIMGYSQHGHGIAALELFRKMQDEGIQPDNIIFACILKACGNIVALDQGKFIHGRIVNDGLETDVVIGTALIDMYAKCSSVEAACKVFKKFPNHDLVFWNAMIAGFAQHEHDLSALQLFQVMQEQGIMFDTVTCSSMLKVCGRIGAIEQGRSIHDQIMVTGLQSHVVVGTSLVDMYAKCGSLKEACKVFNELPNRDLVSWSAMIAGYAQHGESKLAAQCLEDMQQQGLKPDGTIFTSLLAACTRSGQLQEGCRYFKTMAEDYGIVRSIEHFNCMIDLLGHVGHVNEAEELLESMPIPPDIIGWMSLLTACRKYTVVELGRGCFNQVVRLDSTSATGYVLMSNIYADADMWESVHKIEELRKSVGAWKKPGHAWIEVNKQVHEFTVGDKRHAQRDEIYAKLRNLRNLMEGEGYMPQLNLVLKPIADEDKEEALCGHCEKLAIAFGLVNTPEGATIRISKNLRMCPDCHNASKVISKIEKRQIIVRDTYRIHHFEDGSCSCGDLC